MSSRGHEFRSVEGSPRIPRNAFDLSSQRTFTCDMFQLIPVMVEDCLPGDSWDLNAEMVIRMNPLKVPVMHGINVTLHYFFCPYRAMWDRYRKDAAKDGFVVRFDWEDYYTGGEDGLYPLMRPPLIVAEGARGPMAAQFATPYSLYNFLYSHYMTGGNDQSRSAHLPLNTDPVSSTRGLLIDPSPFICYRWIHNEYYRAEEIQDKRRLWSYDFCPPVARFPYAPYLTSGVNGPASLCEWLYRGFEKDYFTAAQIQQQRGTAPALPIGGLASAVFNGPINYGTNTNVTGQMLLGSGSAVAAVASANPQTSMGPFKEWLDDNTIDYSHMTTFDINTLRFTVQVQKWLERNQRTGARYIEHLKAHFKVSPRDDRLQRPEYIGGMRSPIIISEVLQTSNTVANISPQGNMAGHGLTADRGHIGKYFVQEPGLIMGLMSIMPEPQYMSQGIDRMWTKTGRYDEYMSELIHIGEQSVKMSELWMQPGYAVPDGMHEEVFGYDPRYSEYKYRRNTVHGLMLTDFTPWHMARNFTTIPRLNSEFVTPNSAERLALKRALSATSEPMFLVNFANVVPHCVRPLPWFSAPGLMDHF